MKYRVNVNYGFLQPLLSKSYSLAINGKLTSVNVSLGIYMLVYFLIYFTKGFYHEDQCQG